MPQGIQNYAEAKIYKLICPEGYYYYGQTCTSLQIRKCRHKCGSAKMTQKSWNHFNKAGWHLVTIELVEDVDNATCLTDVLRAEDKYLKVNLTDEKCLNMIRAYVKDDPEHVRVGKRRSANRSEEVKQAKREKDAQWKVDNPDKAKEYAKTSYDRNGHKWKEKKAEWYANNYANNEEYKKKSREGGKIYREEHKEQISKGKKEWVEKNKAYVNQKRHDDYVKNKEHENERSKAYAADHKEEIQEYHKTYYKANKEKWGKKAKELVVCPVCNKQVMKQSLYKHKRSKACITSNIHDAPRTAVSCL
jgi:hypothetical protein